MSRVQKTSLRAPSTPKLEDVDAEKVRREHDAKIRELQSLPAAQMAVIPDVQLAEGIATPVQHKLGRAPNWVAPSHPRGASSTGRIDEIRDGSQDRTKVVVLQASGWGATITIDLAVM